MRQKRAKTYRKLMSLYSLTFGFRQPYQILGPCMFHAQPQGYAKNNAQSTLSSARICGI
jgi:hypothetical protein